MNNQMQKAMLLAEQIKSFIDLVYRSYQNESYLVTNVDKVYRMKSLVEEFKFQIIADELERVNRFVWVEKDTLELVNRFREKIKIVEEHVESNYQDLYVFSARLANIRSICQAFTGLSMVVEEQV